MRSLAASPYSSAKECPNEKPCGARISTPACRRRACGTQKSFCDRARFDAEWAARSVNLATERFRVPVLVGRVFRALPASISNNQQSNADFRIRRMRKFERRITEFPPRNFLTNRQGAIYKPSLRSEDLSLHGKGRVFFFWGGGTAGKDSNNVEQEGIFRGGAVFAGRSVQLLLHGQATGSFSGTVSDNSGAVVAGAKVTVTAQATNVSREAVTDDSGHYLVPLLGVGDYTIRVEAQGFKAAEAKECACRLTSTANSTSSL